MSVEINISQLTARYSSDPLSVFYHQSFSLRSPGLNVVVGMSGVGKSTLLNTLGGLLASKVGWPEGLLVECNPITPHISFSDVAYVAQRYSLLPHLRLLDNILLTQRLKLPISVPITKAIREQAIYLVQEVGLDTMRDRWPQELSGGQLQRAALAQALMQFNSHSSDSGSNLLLLDEAFSALDAELRPQLQDLLVQLVRQYDLTVILVSHDLEEAIYLSDHLLLVAPSSSPSKGYSIISEQRLETPALVAPPNRGSWSFRKSVDTLQSMLTAGSAAITAAPMARGVLSESSLSVIEKEAESIMVISRHLLQEHHTPLLRAAVFANLAAGKSYTYVLPENDAKALERFASLKQDAPSPDKIRLVTVSDNQIAFAFGEIVIYNSSKKQQRRAFSYAGDEQGRMLLELHPDFVSNLLSSLPK